MPNLTLPPVAQAVAVMLGVALAIVRLLTASKPFWNALPNKLQKAIPALLVALGLVPAALEHAKTPLDVVTALVLVVGAYFTASRGDQNPPKDSDGGPRLERVNSDPKLTRDELAPPPSIRRDAYPPDEPAEMRAWPSWRYALGPALLAAFGLVALSVVLVGCNPRNPPCDEAKLRAIDARYIERVTAVCLPKYDTKEECPEFPALQADHRRELRAECPQ